MTRTKMPASLLLALLLLQASAVAKPVHESPDQPVESAQASRSGSADMQAAEPAAEKLSPLLALILQPLAEMAAERALDAVGTLFQQWQGRRNPSSGPNGVAAAGNRPADARIVPALAYEVQHLDPTTFAMKRSLPMDKMPQRLRTDEVIALRFATNLPGQIRVESVDGAGLVSELGVYTVMPGEDNRVPRTKGIQLHGTPGEETFRLYFMPCLPPVNAEQPAWAAFKNGLPLCTPASQAALLAARGAGGRSKLAIGLTSSGSDSNITLTALDSFQPDDMLFSQFVLAHER
ncbi:hypothetical protein [Sphaerotilus mobilis]|uniref:Uncharacterized protein n=1 Tax=Sphaerotilus mobilis TaxID=47994 RepID=A0A4Q7LS41_9BURK|nr:hypothetical protein [Sphaerotilus mobilis]RZS57122.1 hypothetical protein EV685_1686 [Sphaerotilus mobilis]